MTTPVALPVRNVPSFDWTRDGMHVRQNVTEGDYVLREDYEALGKRLSDGDAALKHARFSYEQCFAALTAQGENINKALKERDLNSLAQLLHAALAKNPTAPNVPRLGESVSKSDCARFDSSGGRPDTELTGRFLADPDAPRRCQLCGEHLFHHYAPLGPPLCPTTTPSSLPIREEK